MKRKELTPQEATEFTMQPGVRFQAEDRGGSIFDGDILLRFYLPDGRVIEYEAEEESDYYGGSYVKIRWLLTEAVV